VKSLGRILIADDEETFLESTAALLEREGYTIQTARTGAEALAAIEADPCDLLISDLEMPGNADLELVRRLADTAGGLPVIIVTGYPSIRSTMAAIELPVAAYLIKPVAFEDLLPRVRTAVARFRSYQSVREAEQRLGEWRAQMSALSTQAPARAIGASSVDAFLALTVRNVMGSLSDLEQLGKALATQQPPGEPCQIMNCPRGNQLREGIRETIEVLEATKDSFKSKTLANLRHRLELLLQHEDGPGSPNP